MTTHLQAAKSAIESIPDQNALLLAQTRHNADSYFLFEVSDGETAGQILSKVSDAGDISFLSSDALIFPYSDPSLPPPVLAWLKDWSVHNFQNELDYQRFARPGRHRRAQPPQDQFADPDPPPEISGSPTVNEILHAAAIHYVNKLDTSGMASLSYGKLACAWAVNYVSLNSVGTEPGGGAATARMHQSLLAGTGTSVEAENAKPGAIIISPTSGRSIGHVGILGEDGLIYSNSSSQKGWRQNYTVDSWNTRFEAKSLPILYFNLNHSE